MSTDTYRSRAPVRLRGIQLWRRRRADPDPPFPDSAGADSSDDDVSPTNVDALSALLGDNSLSVLEQPIRHLPFGFEYIPRLRDEDVPEDASTAMSRSEEVLAMTANRRRRRSEDTKRRVEPRLRMCASVQA